MKNGKPIYYNSGNIREVWTMGHRWHRIDGPAMICANSPSGWYVSNCLCTSNKEYQKAANLSDEEMTLIILKYGNVE